MRRVLIISPHFPPINAADMQRVRMSLPYFADFGWEAEVAIVDEKFSDLVKDELLLQTVPNQITIHKISAFQKKYTAKFGMGGLALRSINHYRKQINSILAKKKIDLIYFSTTQFPICILGSYWKKKFGIPYVIDMQDPWHSTYYQDKPKSERPPKHWFSYRLNKITEPIAMRSVDGIISVSQKYIDTLQGRYPRLLNRPCQVITFGTFDVDFKIAAKNDSLLDLVYTKDNKHINLVYVGRGGFDVQPAVKILFDLVKKAKTQDPELFNRLRLYFIGTSYATNGEGIPTIAPLAANFGLDEQVIEFTDRIGFYQSIKNLQQSDGLIIIGSNDPSYTASKLYPYILTNKPLLAILHPNSSALSILKKCNAGKAIYLGQNETECKAVFSDYLAQILLRQPTETNWQEFEQYTSRALTEKQVALFNQVISNSNNLP